MRDRINAMVKMREAFRPFAPAVTIEQVDRWFDLAPMTDLPYMMHHRRCTPRDLVHASRASRRQLMI